VAGAENQGTEIYADRPETIGKEPLAAEYNEQARIALRAKHDPAGKEVRYWLKHRPEMNQLFKELEKVVRVSTELK
jgi:hypothetical protein